MQLRYLQTLTEIAAEKNSTIIFPVPIEFLGGLGNLLSPRIKGKQRTSEASGFGSSFYCA